MTTLTVEKDGTLSYFSNAFLLSIYTHFPDDDSEAQGVGTCPKPFLKQAGRQWWWWGGRL